MNVFPPYLRPISSELADMTPQRDPFLSFPLSHNFPPDVFNYFFWGNASHHDQAALIGPSNASRGWAVNSWQAKLRPVEPKMLSRRGRGCTRQGRGLIGSGTRLGLPNRSWTEQPLFFESFVHHWQELSPAAGSVCEHGAWRFCSD